MTEDTPKQEQAEIADHGPEREWWDIEAERAPEFAADLAFARFERRQRGLHVYGGEEF